MIRFTLDKKSPVPFYRQIVDMVLAGVSSGAIAPGDQMPTIREFAVDLEVNPNTIVKAYSHLEILGVLDTQQGSGVFVKARPQQQWSRKESERATEDLCHDFVGRAQLLNIQIQDLVECLTRMQSVGSKAGKDRR